jgi:Sigma-70 region 2
MVMTARSDDEAVTALALAAARGNARALETFIRATQQDVWRFVANLSDAGSADDLTQETFLRAIGAIHRFFGAPAPAAGCWLSRAVSSPITSVTPNRGPAPPMAPILNTCSTETATPGDSKTWLK